MKCLIPKAGPRLKFKRYFDAFLASTNQFISDPVTTHNESVSNCDSFSFNDSPSLNCSASYNNSPTLNCSLSFNNSPTLNSSPSNSPLTDSMHSESSALCSSPSVSSHKNINVKKIIGNKLPDIYEKLEKGDPANINILEKYRINRVLVNSYIEQYDCRPSTSDKLNLAKDIVNTFPVLKGSEGEGFVSNLLLLLLLL